MMIRTLITVGVLCLFVMNPLGSSAQMAVVDFESQTVGAAFGSSSSHAPGDLIFTEDGINVSVETDLAGSFNNVVIGGFTDSDFTTTPVTISNINLGFDFSNLAYDVGKVTFEYLDFGGDENLGVNGSVVELAQLIFAPASLGGASITVTQQQGSFREGYIPGTVQVIGAIESVTVGGQEFGMDNLVAMAVPEPSTCLLLITSTCFVGLSQARKS